MKSKPCISSLVQLILLKIADKDFYFAGPLPRLCFCLLCFFFFILFLDLWQDVARAKKTIRGKGGREPCEQRRDQRGDEATLLKRKLPASCGRRARMGLFVLLHSKVESRGGGRRIAAPGWTTRRDDYRIASPSGTHFRIEAWDGSRNMMTMRKRRSATDQRRALQTMSSSWPTCSVLQSLFAGYLVSLSASLGL